MASVEMTQQERDALLEKFMKEFFPFNDFLKIGLFKKEMRGDYKAQSERVCKFFGFDSIYEYGAVEIRAHISYVDDYRPENEPFVSVLPSIYE